MGKIVLYIATSIDGRIADANSSVQYLDGYGRPEEDYGYQAFLQRIGTVVMGAATYEKILSFSYWYEGMEHVIFSSRELEVPEGRSIRKLSGDPTELAQELRGREKDSWLVGGAVLLNSFLERNLVDEMIITIVPEYLGAGISLWQDGKPGNSTWKLGACRYYDDGVVQLQYLRQ
ncbi:MAG: dihydrofolate reductase family protein [Chitinophagaceae bacterium]|jgi:dihydrofolate reductase|nr:dihydrofolate reductase family protein [Chitinophagaceae bacterium]